MEIVGQPKDQFTVEGDTALFTVTTKGDDLSYRWFYRRGESDSWHPTGLPGYNTPTLSVAMTTGRNGYQYYCQVSDAYGQTVNSKTVTLTLKTRLAILTQPGDQGGTVGENALFTVEAQGDELSYRWYYRRGEADSWHTTSMTGFNTPTLTVAVTESRFGYQYYCLITDAYGSEIGTEPATLKPKPADAVITAQPADVTAAEGETAKFTVVVDGENLTYRWYYRRGAADSWHTTSMTGYNTSELQVPVYASRNGYQYYCVITDANGNTLTTETATLTVN
jgi:hypothetical protein